METTSTSLEIEQLERKVAMSLDEIIKMQKKLERKAKKSSRKRVTFTRKNVSQGTVASRFSAVRQGRFADSTPRHRGLNFLAAKNAAGKVSNRNDGSKMKRKNGKRSRKSTRPSGGATRNIKVLISNELSRRLSTKGRKRVPAARLSCASDELVINGPGRNSQTLDSRFASLRGRRVQYSGWCLQSSGRDGLQITGCIAEKY